MVMSDCGYDRVERGDERQEVAGSREKVTIYRIPADSKPCSMSLSKTSFADWWGLGTLCSGL